MIYTGEVHIHQIVSGWAITTLYMLYSIHTGLILVSRVITQQYLRWRACRPCVLLVGGFCSEMAREP